MRSDSGLQNGRVVWITGGGSGIGLAGGIELARAGAHVVISGAAAKPAGERKADQGGPAAARRSRSTSPTRRRWRARRRDPKRHGRVDILINSAGINHPKRNFRNVSIDGWNQIVAVNLSGNVLLRAGGAAGMRERKDGLIINVSRGPGATRARSPARATTPPSTRWSRSPSRSTWKSA
jgi:NAD(P)-dependent dehydrogenase (short-subunit alcohol dehydrogenase family)